MFISSRIKLNETLNPRLSSHVIHTPTITQVHVSEVSWRSQRLTDESDRGSVREVARYFEELYQSCTFLSGVSDSQ